MSLQIEGLSKAVGSFALREISLAVPAGRYCVILGPSGSGKSMLMRCVAGLLQPDSGRVSVADEDLVGRLPERRRMGYVFQEASLFPHLNVQANVAYGLRARKLPKADIQQRLQELGERMGIAALWTRRTTSLSGGEAQRVALARALAIRPRLLLLDEPLSQVDRAAREELQEELKRLHAELGLCVLHVTHDRDEARALGQDCAILLGGRLIQSGSVAEVFEKPRCAFVARFLGTGREGIGAVDCTEICLAGRGQCDGKG